jgi:CRISPR-associated protein Csd1
MQLRSNSARKIISSFNSIDIESLEENIKKHFENMKILDDKKFGLVKIIAEIENVDIQKEKSRIGDMLKNNSNLVSEYLDSILYNQDYPYYSIAMKILDGCCRRGVNQIKASIIKSLLNRNFKKGIKPMLDETIRNPAYLCGRILALGDTAQYRGKYRKNKNKISDNFYSLFLSSPRNALTLVCQEVIIHINSIDNIGSRINMDKMFNGLVDMIGVNDIKRFSVDDGFMCTLGFAQQRQFSFNKIANDPDINEEIKMELVEQISEKVDDVEEVINVGDVAEEKN